MKTLWLFVCMWACAHALGRGDLEKYGPVRLKLSGLNKCDHNRSLNLDVSGINVHFYDFQKNDVKNFTIGNAAKGILGIKKLNKTKKFIIFVAGFTSNINDKTEEKVRQTFRNFPNSYLIILDHSPYTNDKEGYEKGYRRSVKYVHYIGKAVGQMLAGLSQGGIFPKNMHCIGFSLGGQILGHAGEMFINITRQKIWRITALDPAGPCFYNDFPALEIRSGLAQYVEVYHCNAGGFGTTSVLADIDFFVNRKGAFQPNCSTPPIPGIYSSITSNRCSHRACVDIWMASVSHPTWFLAKKCDKYRDFKNGNCSQNVSTIAGFWNPGNAAGKFYFSTKGYEY
ncbi:hypothetical protein ABMA27_014957 [Loxostege sticticalis]|uniref:Lipase domain-containing protein n=1 Tax=Loxostege sticticalis TaxID=481309 RepID=A0ABR3IAT7_LOXSC